MNPFILTSALDVGEWSGLYTGRFTLVKKPPVSFKIIGWAPEKLWKFWRTETLLPLPSFFLAKQGKFLALLFYFFQTALWRWSRLSL